MARVPIIDLPQEQLTTQGFGQIQVDPRVEPVKNVGAQQAVEGGAAMEKAGNQMIRLADRLQSTIDDAKSNEAFNNFALQVDEIENGYLGTNGKQAIDGYQGTRASVDKIYQEALQGLDNDVQRMVFSNAATRRVRSAYNSMTGHSLRVTRDYDIKETQGKVTTFTGQAARAWTTIGQDGGDFEVYLGSALKETNYLADKLGLPADSSQRTVMLQETASLVHTQVALNMQAAGKNIDALNYIEDMNKAGQMTADQYQQTRRTVLTGARKEAGIDAGRRVMEGAGKATATSFDDAVSFVLAVEGGYVADDAGKGPSKYGINKSANPDVDIANLTTDQAKDIYRTNYWEAINADNLPANVRLLAFDTAVNMGPAAARRLLKEANNDPVKMIELRRQHYANLIARDPNKYEKYKVGWENRLKQLEAGVAAGPQGEVTGGRYELPSLSTMISTLKTTVTDPETLEYATAWVTQEYNTQVALRDEEYRATLQEAQDIAYAPGGSWTKIPPATLARLKPEDRAKLVEGAPRGDNPDTVIQLLDNPNLWKKGSIEKFRPMLSEATYQRFYAQGNKPAEAAEATIREATIDSEQFNATLLRAQMTDLINPKSDAQKADLIRLRDMYQRAIDEDQSVKKRKISLQEKQVLLDKLIVDQVRISEIGRDPVVPLFRVSEDQMKDAYVIVGKEEIPLKSIPADQRANIMAALRAENEPVTELNIATYWVRAGKPGQRVKK